MILFIRKNSRICELFTNPVRAKKPKGKNMSDSSNVKVTIQRFEDFEGEPWGLSFERSFQNVGACLMGLVEFFAFLETRSEAYQDCFPAEDYSDLEIIKEDDGRFTYRLIYLKDGSCDRSEADCLHHYAVLLEEGFRVYRAMIRQEGGVADSLFVAPVPPQEIDPDDVEQVKKLHDEIANHSIVC
jgi:hypothetical protein